jgi:hypothetical protein
LTGGLFCQWLPLFQLSEVEVNILVRTFLTVFPHAQVWRGDFSPSEPAIALIGSAGDSLLDATIVQRRLSEMRPDASNRELSSPEIFWMHFVGMLELSDLPANDTRLNREDRPWVELLGPLNHTGGTNETLFTGRRLQSWLNQISERSRNRLGSLPDAQRSAMSAGATLSEMILCLSEDDHKGVRAAQARLKEMLRAETFHRLFP